MLIWATRQFSALTLRAAFYGALFIVVAVAQVGITTSLREAGWPGGGALAVSGAVVLAIVLGGVQLGEFIARTRASWRERQRKRQSLPTGPCCVVWNSGDGGEYDMPWELVGHLHASYPRLARRFGVEGVAVVEFEINSAGRPKNVHCVDAWPSDVFFEAAKTALLQARFKPRDDEHPRFGAAYRLPFVFRISGAARTNDRGVRAKPARPVLQAAAQAVEKLRKAS